MAWEEQAARGEEEQRPSERCWRHVQAVAGDVGRHRKTGRLALVGGAALQECVGLEISCKVECARPVESERRAPR